MQKTVDYYLFLLSPWSYLGTEKFNGVVKKHNLKVNYKPISVMDTFEQMGGVPPMKRHPSRQRFRLDELSRWSKYLNVPINLNPAFWPTDQSLAAQMVYAATQLQLNPGPLVDSILAAVWLNEADIADEQTLVDLAEKCSFNADTLINSARTEQIATLYQDTTSEAHNNDVFGSPTFIYNDELFWGQDRIDFLDRALKNG